MLTTRRPPAAAFGLKLNNLKLDLNANFKISGKIIGIIKASDHGYVNVTAGQIKTPATATSG